MRRTLVLGTSVAATLAGATVAFAAGAQPLGDDYGYPTATSTTSTSTTTTPATRSRRAPQTRTYRAALRTKSAVPKPDAPARAAGSFSATVRDKGTKATVRWTLTFRRLTGRAVAAHIHIGRPGVAGPVVLPLCGPCKTGTKGRGTLTRAQARMLQRGRGYVNVHTARNAAGEIRGQLKLVRRN